MQYLHNKYTLQAQYSYLESGKDRRKYLITKCLPSTIGKKRQNWICVDVTHCSRSVSVSAVDCRSWSI